MTEKNFFKILGERAWSRLDLSMSIPDKLVTEAGILATIGALIEIMGEKQGEGKMTEKRFCVECGAQIKFDVGRREWICYASGDPVLWIPQESGAGPITSKARKLADEIKALREEYNLSFNEALLLARPSLYYQ